MGGWRTAVGAACAGLLLCGATADARAGGGGPIDLELADLDQLTGGAWEPTMPLFDRGTFDRRSFIQTSISMPIANAFAVCFMCSGDASAVAVAAAFGSGRADSTSFASGRGDAFTSSFAAGPPFIFVLPESFGSPDFQASR